MCVAGLCALFCQTGVALADWESEGRGYVELLHGAAEKQLSQARADNAHLYVEGALSNDNQRLFAALDAGYYRYAPEQSGVKVKEAYWAWLGDNADVTIGRQIIPWGKADGITVTDRISPKNRRQWLGTEYQDTRLGVDAVKLRYLRDESTSELIWIPFPRLDAVPSDADNPLAGLYRPSQTLLNNQTVALRYPEGDKPNSIKDSEWAFRQSFYGSSMDVSLSVFRGWDREVARVPQIKGNEIIMQPRYHRITQFGLDVAVPEGERVWRGELAYLPNRLLVDRHGQAAKHQQWLGLLGVDWQLDNWTITAQYFADKVSDAENLARDDLQSALTLSVDKKFLRDKLLISTGAYVDVNRGSSAWSLKADYDVDDALSFSAGLNHFESGGRSDSALAGMVPLSSVWLRMRYDF